VLAIERLSIHRPHFFRLEGGEQVLIPSKVNNGQNPTAPVNSNIAPMTTNAPAMVDESPAKRPIAIASTPAPIRIGRSIPPTLHVIVATSLSHGCLTP
jgi:hypothetical protein